jgi:hypothetical protein
LISATKAVIPVRLLRMTNAGPRCAQSGAVWKFAISKGQYTIEMPRLSTVEGTPSVFSRWAATMAERTWAHLVGALRVRLPNQES